MAFPKLSLAACLACVLSNAAVAAGQCSNTLDTFDFIVIGGGTAGLAVAARLSEGLTESCVLVVEAGPDGRAEPRISIPGRKGSTIGTTYDWNLTTTAQSGLNANRRINMSRGKVLGGSSAMNLMTWDRGAVADFNAWETLGNPGWNWDTMFSSMLKCESFEPSNEYESTNGVGTSGPVDTLINRILPTHQLTFKPAMNALGIADNNASLAGNPVGVARKPTNIRPSDYSRSYSTAYIENVPANLAVLTDTRVARINFDSNKVATGITLQNGAVLSVKHEVILSAGSLQSPGLLELSGIGDQDVLKAAGVDVVYHNPNVGENLQDHVRIQNSYQLKPEFLSFDVLRWNTTFADSQLALYNLGLPSLWDYTGSGYAYMNWTTLSPNIGASMLSLAQANANLSSQIDQIKLAHLVNESSTVPQLEIIFSDGYTGVKGYPAANTPLFSQGFFTLIAAIQHPFSKGNVHISSSDITVNPNIDPKYLSNPYDLAAVINAAKYLRKAAETAPMSSIWSAEYEPGPTVQTDADWEAFAKNTTLSIYHPVGTCSMLPENAGGVVDAELKVYGVKGVRVVDASIMPIIPSTHLQTAVYGIAERAAELVVKEWS
ncbi:hypothetical protein HYFRA_00009665 [Hymenoscyphus fraxineus]|uniref:Glucose-methanol-choline oxidoreductase N-terminal domain-containing protein n=1 Tax=Hymenoscyphus fraxineus TaxID=746836 RepID=A0A9N9KRG8_9HELO|nr:hypothetical protein HYFRA_00009665 [Hymenoscyphus fraxineus]